jgi:alpha-1,2-mannosyltransferase
MVRGAAVTNRWTVRAAPPLAAKVAAALVLSGVAAWTCHEVVTGLSGNVFGMVDLSVYRAGGRAVLDHADLYQMRAPVSRLPFTYPPFAALTFVPLAVVGVGLGQLLFTLVSVGLLARVTWLVCRAALPPWADRGWLPVAACLVLALGLGLEPTSETLRLGQVNLVLLWLVVEDLLGDVPPRFRGLLVGLAAGFKLTPAVFLVYLALTGRRLAAVRGGLTFAGTAALGFVMLPHGSWQYWAHDAYDVRRVGGIAFASNQSLNGALSRLMPSAEHSKLVWLLGATVVLICGLAVAKWLHAAGRELLAVSVTALAGLVASPVSWDHHWVWLLPVVVGLAGEAARASGPARRAWLVVTAGALVVLFSSRVIYLPPNRENRELAWHGWQLVAGNAFLLAALLVLGVLMGCFLGSVRRRQVG